MNQAAISNVVCRLVQSCVGKKDLRTGKEVHAFLIRCGWDSRVVGSTLMDMYIRQGRLQNARHIFDSLHNKDIMSWNTMVAAYAKHNHAEEAMKLLNHMVRDGVRPTRMTFLSILKSCSSRSCLVEGKVLHEKVLEAGLGTDRFVGSALVEMYCKCRSVKNARVVFDSLPDTDLVCWNVMIGGYAVQGDGENALLLFYRMDLQPDKYTFASVLKGCSKLGALEHGELIHSQVVSNNLDNDNFIGSTLIDMYAQCGSLEHARGVFDHLAKKDLVVVTAMITAYALLGDGKGALDLYVCMRKAGYQPNEVTFLSILKACSSVQDLAWGKLVHSHIRKYGFESSVFLGSTLIDMYAKCGSLENARTVFDNLATRNLVSWTAMIGGYAQKGQGQQALQLFDQMQQQGLIPNKVTFVHLLKACSSIAALSQGKYIHHLIVERGLENEPIISSSIIDMYAKCGGLDHARSVFAKLLRKELVTWNAIIAGEAQHGQSQNAFQLFDQMQTEGLRPSEVTFLSLLSACSHAGLLNKATSLLQTMYKCFGITPQSEHYGCVVDLLCRAGLLREALDVIYAMPCEPDVLVWKSLLVACRTLSEVEFGSFAFERIRNLDPDNIAAHVLMAQICRDTGRVDEELEVRRKMRNLNVRKEPGRSWLEHDKQVHTFKVEDTDHPERRRVFDFLSTLRRPVFRHCGQICNKLERADDLGSRGLPNDELLASL